MTSPDETTVRFVCRRCFTRLKVPKSAVGVRLRCPKCQLMATVPAQSREPGPGEEYPLWQGAGTSALAQERLLPVTCPVCNTRMYAAADQVGREMVCPDCGTATVVTPPAEPPQPAKKTPGPAAIGEYAVRAQEQAAPTGHPSNEPTYLHVYCPVCNTLMHATEDQVGKELVCPDCNTSVVVPRPLRPPAQKPRPAEGAGGEYGVGRPAKLPEYEASKDYRVGRRLPDDAPPAEAWRPRAELPQWPLVVGIFDFPFRRGALMRWLGLSLAAMVAAIPAMMAVALAAVPAAGLITAPLWIGSMVLTGVAALLAVGWLAVAAVNFLAILLDTSYGYDDVENWPRGAFLDWIGEAFYVVNALASSLLFGLAVAYGFHALGLPGGWSVPASVWLFFPVVLLAMLETNSPLNPISMAVWQSLRTSRQAWATFYVETAILGALLGGITTAMATVAPAVAFFGAPVLLVAAVFIYARLLGRLARCCAAQSDEREEDEASNEEQQQ